MEHETCCHRGCDYVRSYLGLKNLVGNKLDDVSRRIKYKLASEINLIHKMTEYHVKSGGKRIRPLLTLGSAKLCGYAEGNRDINTGVIKLFNYIKKEVSAGNLNGILMDTYESFEALRCCIL